MLVCEASRSSSGYHIIQICAGAAPSFAAPSGIIDDGIEPARSAGCRKPTFVVV